MLSCIEGLVNKWDICSEEKEVETVNLNLRKEFAYLFLTPQGVHPYESIYVGKRSLLMDRPWEEVKGFYRSIGMEKDKKEIHPEDHIAVELGFMATFSFLSGRTLRGTEVDEIDENELSFALRVQYDFLEQHLLKWVPGLCHDILEKTRHPFYRSIAELTRGFLDADYIMLRELCPAL